MTLGELIATNQCSRLKKRLCSSYSILRLKKKSGFKISVSENQNNNKIKNKTIISHYTDDIYKNNEINHGLSLNIDKRPIELMHVPMTFSFH